jgi:two-component system, OmpR family, phosphate regulon response regulator PhoB
MRSVGVLDSDKPLVLVVDDEAALAAMLRYNLERHGFLVEHATNGRAALVRIAEGRPDLVLLDWTLPVMSGIEVCRQLRSRPDTRDLRVIMVTGRTGDQDAVRGLDAGADDYVVKPFSVDELLARMRALLRRTKAVTEWRRRLQLQDIAMDFAAFRVTRSGRTVHLGPTEFRLLKFLMQHPNRIFSRRELMDALWGPDVHVEPRTLDVHVWRLRKSINCGGERDVIRTVRMAGYVFETE